MDEKKKMKLTRSETYEAGYSREEILKKCAAAASAVLMCGSLASCGDTLSGDVEYDGNMTVQAVSASDTDTDDNQTYDGDLQYDGDTDSTTMSFRGITTDPVSGQPEGDEEFLLDGDVYCAPPAFLGQD